MTPKGPSYSWKELDEYCQDVLSDLVTVELIGRLRSKTRAAEELSISLPALRSRLIPLERRLKGPVVEAGRHGDLPPLGKRVRKLWGAVRAPLEEFIREVAQLHDQRDLHLSIIQSVWNTEKEWLESEYAMRMPGGSIQPSIADGYYAIENQVRDGTVDVGVVSFPPPQDEIAPPVRLHFWRNEPMVLVVEYVHAIRIPNHVEVTVEYMKTLDDTLYTMPEGTPTYHAVHEYLKRNSIHFKYRVPVEDANEALKRAMGGGGITILPEPVVKQAAHDLKVEMFLLKPALVRPIYIVYRENSLKKKLVDAFLECIEAHKKDEKRRMLSD